MTVSPPSLRSAAGEENAWRLSPTTRVHSRAAGVRRSSFPCHSSFYVMLVLITQCENVCSVAGSPMLPGGERRGQRHILVLTAERPLPSRDGCATAVLPRGPLGAARRPRRLVNRTETPRWGQPRVSPLVRASPIPFRCSQRPMQGWSKRSPRAIPAHPSDRKMRFATCGVRQRAGGTGGLSLDVAPTHRGGRAGARAKPPLHVTLGTARR
jgi:hypothetical protein